MEDGKDARRSVGEGREDRGSLCVARGSDVVLPEEIGLFECRRLAGEVGFEVRGSDLRNDSARSAEPQRKKAHLEELIGHPSREVPVVKRKVEELVLDRERLVVGVRSKTISFVVCEPRFSLHRTRNGEPSSQESATCLWSCRLIRFGCEASLRSSSVP